MSETVVLGLSDGVDSAVSAALLKDAGYAVRGLYMDISDENARDAACLSAEQLKIDLRVVDISERLEKFVCEPFAAAYMAGETPNPCTMCNPAVKFDALEKYAREIGAEYIATGHYAVCADGRLYMGNADSDQSYMLCGLYRRQVERLKLPLGAFSKARVREIAAERGLATANKPDSREICFITGESYISWLERRGLTGHTGDVIYEGNVIAAHSGICSYTVGQRWRDTFGGRRLYVSEINPENNTITLCLWEDLFKNRITVKNLNLLADPPSDTFRGSVRVRHTRWETPECTVRINGTSAEIETDSPLRAPAKGQTAALYIGRQLIGGGKIS